MAQAGERELSLETTRRIVVYDTHTGEVVYVHEFMSEADAYAEPDPVSDPESVRRMALRDFERRSLQVLEVPRDYELKPGASYWVDPVSSELMDVTEPTERFRDFVRRETSNGGV